jgi:hypothetical protein
VYVAELDRGFLPDLVVICGEPVEAEGKPAPSKVFSLRLREDPSGTVASLNLYGE